MANGGNKTIFGTSGNDLLKGDHNDGDTIDGLGGNDTIRALAGNDFLTGGDGNDKVYGAAGNDLIIEGLGDDYINGGLGTDSLSCYAIGAAITVDLALTGAQNTGAGGVDTIIGIENLTGTAFGDMLFGSSIANTINGGNGNDVIDGRGGNDILSGGNGNDTLLGGTGNDTLRAAEGSAADVDVFDGGSGTDTLDYLFSALTTGVTVDLRKTTAQDVGGGLLNSISNIENVSGTVRDDALTGNARANTLFGGAGHDVVTGLGGNDVLDGFTGSDSVNGGAGNDIISGGMIGAIGEHDILTGGTGADTFVFENIGFSRVDSSDRITDFSAAEGDKIDMRNTTFFLPQVFIDHADFSNVAGQVRVANGPDGLQYVEVDYDADSVADLRIEVVSATTLEFSDFIF